MTRVVFENATFADAIRKADRVAPGRGRAFDEAGGIVLEVGGTDGLVIVRATNTDIFHTEWVTTLKVEGEPCKWRLPSNLIAGIMASLPIGTGKEVTLEEVQSGMHSHLKLTSGRTVAKINLMDPTYYPKWETFNPDELKICKDLGGSVAMVEWAAAKAEPPLSGVHFTGSEVLATDRYRLAVAPMVIENMPGEITVPAGILGQILKQTGEVRIGFTSNQMLIMPDDSTQIRVVIYGGDYPGVKRLMNRESPQTISVKKQGFLDIINRVVIAGGNDRLPTLKLFIGKEELAVMCEGQENNLIGDVLEIDGQALHDRIEVKFTPRNLTDALSKAPSESVTIGYDIEKPAGHMYVNGGSGYEVWVVTRAEGSVS